MDSGPKPVDLPTFHRVMAEGEKLEQIASFQKAIASYSRVRLDLWASLSEQALEAVSPNGPLEDPVGRTCLCARSRCYLQTGDHNAALKDAEASLKDDKTFIKGIFAKAEALYFKGDFEFALVYYHRGNKLRGELQEFRLGIQKAQEAIVNAVGSPETCKLEVPLESENTRTLSASSKATQKKTARPQVLCPSAVLMAKDGAKGATQKAQSSDRTVKQLLGELYADRQYLEDLLSEPWASGDDGGMSQLVTDGIQYLDKRTDFWRQQKPIYAREHEQRLRTTKKPLTKTLQKQSDGEALEN